MDSSLIEHRVYFVNVIYVNAKTELYLTEIVCYLFHVPEPLPKGQVEKKHLVLVSTQYNIT